MSGNCRVGDDANAVNTPAPTASERGELVTDRPDFTESSLVVGKGIWQLETGAIYGGEGHRRVEGAGFENTAGGADFELGAKLTLLDEEKHGIAMSVIPIVSFPTGSAAFSSGGVERTDRLAPDVCGRSDRAEARGVAGRGYAIERAARRSLDASSIADGSTSRRRAYPDGVPVPGSAGPTR